MISPSVLSLLPFLAALSPSSHYATAQNENEYRAIVNAQLTNNHIIPFIGLGVGNAEHEDIPSMLSKSFGKPHLDYHLIDTARASENEELIATTLSEKFSTTQQQHVHVVTKVWYTHLGYDRTKLSVTESLADLEPDVFVHVLLHWPRCDDHVEWMNCQQEEDDLPDHVKDAGPSPLNEPDIFLDSWKALEELYLQYDEIASIGVSNFGVQDWRLLLENCNIVPHIHQGDIWSYFNKPSLRSILEEHRVMFQAYNVMHGIIANLENLKKVNDRLNEIATEIHVEKVSTLILAWMLQNKMGVVFMSTDENHIEENSPYVVGMVKQFEPEVSDELRDLIFLAVGGHDDISEIEGLKAAGVQVTFFNELEKDVKVYWVDGNEKLVHVDEVAAKGDTSLGSHPGHQFVVKENDESEALHTFEVTVDYGGYEEFFVEL
mmetsp:Transcript_27656/g.33635  ORF Transcript_27656/g.33635 Transcript_27656/m.33635 type:complete len:433 (+) Transcript_27656:18-1316(+)